jgi:perosamine synthetase
MKFIPVYQPFLKGNERKYVLDCIDSSWISSKGKYVEKFQDTFREYIKMRYATAVSNGTVAIHLALLALGIGPGDEVIVPTFTYVASVNPIIYVGATPVFVDSDPDSWQLSVDDVIKKITPRTRAIIAVHLYGCPVDMEALMSVARQHRLFVVEDCAEAFGSRISDKHVGTFGDIATFSFFGNKTITTGEGGMVVTDDSELHDKIEHFKGQGLARNRTYWHDVVGYNYRMTNICAAIGLAQLERVDEIIEKKQTLAARYTDLLKNLPINIHHTKDKEYFHTYWMYSILVPASRRDGIILDLADSGIETRPTFYPVHTMPMYRKHVDEHYVVAEKLGASGINLPSWPELSYFDQVFIVEELQRCLLK